MLAMDQCILNLRQMQVLSKLQDNSYHWSSTSLWLNSHEHQKEISRKIWKHSGETGWVSCRCKLYGRCCYLMKGSGIEELLVENNACNRGTAEKVLDGKDYYKMLRFHLLPSEANTGLLCKEFEQWLASENVLKKIYDHVLGLSDSLKEKDAQSTNQSGRQDIMNCLKDLIPLWLELEESLGLTAGQ